MSMINTGQTLAPTLHLGHNRSRISWGAVLAGAVVAVATTLLLSLLGAAMGAGSIHALDTTSTDLANYGTGAAIWEIINLALSMAFGGYVAARLSGTHSHLDAELHGITVWGVAVLLGSVLLAQAVGGLIGMAWQSAGSVVKSFYQRMLARDPVEAVEQAKSFMARHSLCDYCDEVVRPALMLAQKDTERGILEEGNAKVLRETVDGLFADIAHEHWVARREAHAAILAPTANLAILNKDQLALSWRSEAALVSIGVRTELDEAAAIVLSTIAKVHGIGTRIERPEALKAANLTKLDFTGVSMICLSSVDMKTPAHIHYAARRLKSRAPHAKLLLTVWSARDDKALTGLKEAINADYSARSFHQATAIILEEAAARQQVRTENLRGEYSAHA